MNFTSTFLNLLFLIFPSKGYDLLVSKNEQMGRIDSIIESVRLEYAVNSNTPSTKIPQRQSTRKIQQVYQKYFPLFLLSNYQIGHENETKNAVYISSFQLQIIESVRDRPLQATWALLLWPTWVAAADREPTLLFVAERNCRR